MSVCKPKDKNVNNKHIAKRYVRIADRAIDIVIQIGADILEANAEYVGKNISPEQRQINFQTRIRLQREARRLTFELEHIIRVLHKDNPFADSTITYWTGLLVESRSLISKWLEKTERDMRS